MKNLTDKQLLDKIWTLTITKIALNSFKHTSLIPDENNKNIFHMVLNTDELNNQDAYTNLAELDLKFVKSITMPVTKLKPRIDKLIANKKLLAFGKNGNFVINSKNITPMCEHLIELYAQLDIRVKAENVTENRQLKINKDNEKHIEKITQLLTMLLKFRFITYK